MNINACNYFYNQFLFYYFSSPILFIFKYLMDSIVSMFLMFASMILLTRTLTLKTEPRGTNVALRTLTQKSHDFQASLNYIARLCLNR